MDDEDFYTYESEGEYGFFSDEDSNDESNEEQNEDIDPTVDDNASEEEGLSEELEPIIVTEDPDPEGPYDVILKIGGWKRGIVLTEHRGSFIEDWYSEYGTPGAVLDLTGGKVDFIRTQWPLLERLMQWEALGPRLFHTGRTLSQREEPEELRQRARAMGLRYVPYSEVSPIARTVGSSSLDWELYTVVDRHTPQSERMDWYRRVGVLLRHTPEVDLKLYPSYLTMVLEHSFQIIDRMRASVELEDIVRGMKHNALVKMIGDDNGLPFSLHHLTDLSFTETWSRNKLTSSTAQGSVALLNWAYIIWEDVVHLFTRYSAGTPFVAAEYLSGLPSERQTSVLGWNFHNRSVELAMTPNAFEVGEYAIPVLYAITMDRVEEGSLYQVGMQCLYEEDPSLSIGTFSSMSLRDVPFFINKAAVLASPAHKRTKYTWEDEVELDTSRIHVTVGYMIDILGWFAMDKVYSLATGVKKPLSRFGRLFMEELGGRLKFARKKIDKYRKMDLYLLAENDVDGMLLNRLPRLPRLTS